MECGDQASENRTQGRDWTRRGRAFSSEQIFLKSTGCRLQVISTHENQVWCLMPVMPALRQLRQRIALSSMSEGHRVGPFLKKQIIKKKWTYWQRHAPAASLEDC